MPLKHEENEMIRWLTGHERILFYPGAGEDILRPIKRFSNVVDTYHFVDNGEGYPNLFHRLCLNGLHGPVFEGTMQYVQWEMRYQGRNISIRYYNKDHRDYMNYMRQIGEKIDVLILRGYQDGEGGCGFTLVIDPDSDDYSREDFLSICQNRVVLEVDEAICLQERDTIEPNGWGGVSTHGRIEPIHHENNEMDIMNRVKGLLNNLRGVDSPEELAKIVKPINILNIVGENLGYYEIWREQEHDQVGDEPYLIYCKEAYDYVLNSLKQALRSNDEAICQNAFETLEIIDTEETRRIKRDDVQTIIDNSEDW